MAISTAKIMQLYIKSPLFLFSAQSEIYKYIKQVIGSTITGATIIIKTPKGITKDIAQATKAAIITKDSIGCLFIVSFIGYILSIYK